jgi:hypothetical protein
MARNCTSRCSGRVASLSKKTRNEFREWLVGFTLREDFDEQDLRWYPCDQTDVLCLVVNDNAVLRSQVASSVASDAQQITALAEYDRRASVYFQFQSTREGESFHSVAEASASAHHVQIHDRSIDEECARGRFAIECTGRGILE